VDRSPIRDTGTGETYHAHHSLSPRQVKIVLAGGQIPLPSHRGGLVKPGRSSGKEN